MNTLTVAEVRGVYFGYDNKTVLEDINLQVTRGEFLAIMGPNGSGKTTLLKIMLGLIKPQRGQVLLFGQSLDKFNAWHRVGYVPQKATNFDQRFPATVEEVVSAGRFGLRGIGRWLKAGDRQAVQEALQLVDMADRKHDLIGNLSGGQQQRVFIARTLAGNPELILLDEPIVGLDPQAQEQFYSLLTRLNQERGITFITVTHDTGAVGQQVNRLACINHRLIYHGAPENILAQESLARAYGPPVKLVGHRH